MSGHANEIMEEVSRQSGCGVVGLQETRRDCHNGSIAAAYAVYCCGADGGASEVKGQHGVGLALKESILQKSEKDGLAVEYIRARLVKVRLNLEGESNGISFLCGWVRASGSNKNHVDSRQRYLVGTTAVVDASATCSVFWWRERPPKQRTSNDKDRGHRLGREGHRVCQMERNT